MINSVIKNWGLIKDFVHRDFKARFAGSILGVVWNIIHPLVMIGIYILVFSQVMRARLPGLPTRYGYTLYLCAAMLPWGMFNELMLRYTNLFFEHANLIKKVSFPKEILHVAAMLTGSINFAISFGIFFIFLAVLHLTGAFIIVMPVERIFLLLVVLILQQVFCLGLGFATSVLNVFFRDIGQLVSIVMQLWFWFTPIVYPLSVVPERLKGFFRLNPFYHFIEIYRSILYLNKMPAWGGLGIVAAISGVIFVLGYLIYQKLRDDVPDEI